jgi:hypothetical protein
MITPHSRWLKKLHLDEAKQKIMLTGIIEFQNFQRFRKRIMPSELLVVEHGYEKLTPKVS